MKAGGVLVDHLGAARAGDIGGDQVALDRGGGEPFVPERDRELGERHKVARKDVRRLRARSKISNFCHCLEL
jgi:hypothetical protein